MEFIIFSKNRAAQLDLLLRSIAEYQVDKSDRINVMYTHDSDYEAGYNKLREKIKEGKIVGDIRLIKECGFRETFLDILKEVESESVCLLTDDSVFFHTFSPENPDKNEVFSYRMGYNIRVQDHIHGILLDEILRPQEFINETIMWNPHHYRPDNNLGYIFHPDGNVYNTAQIFSLLSNGGWHNTNSFESYLNRNCAHTVDKMRSYIHSVMVNIPANCMSGVTLTNTKHPRTLRELEDVFVVQEKVLKLPDNLVVIGCHQDIPYEYV